MANGCELEGGEKKVENKGGWSQAWRKHKRPSATAASADLTSQWAMSAEMSKINNINPDQSGSWGFSAVLGTEIRNGLSVRCPPSSMSFTIVQAAVRWALLWGSGWCLWSLGQAGGPGTMPFSGRNAVCVCMCTHVCGVYVVSMNIFVWGCDVHVYTLKGMCAVCVICDCVCECGCMCAGGCAYVYVWRHVCVWGGCECVRVWACKLREDGKPDPVVSSSFLLICHHLRTYFRMSGSVSHLTNCRGILYFLNWGLDEGCIERY